MNGAQLCFIIIVIMFHISLLFSLRINLFRPAAIVSLSAPYLPSVWPVYFFQNQNIYSIGESRCCRLQLITHLFAHYAFVDMFSPPFRFLDRLQKNLGNWVGREQARRMMFPSDRMTFHYVSVAIACVSRQHTRNRTPVVDRCRPPAQKLRLTAHLFFFLSFIFCAFTTSIDTYRFRRLRVCRFGVVKKNVEKKGV